MSLGQPLSQLMTGVLLKQNKQGTSLHKPSAGESGGNIKMGFSGPNNPITGVSTAPATCTGPESMEIIKSQRSEEHTSELQSRVDLVCRLLLEKKKNIN